MRRPNAYCGNLNNRGRGGCVASGALCGLLTTAVVGCSSPTVPSTLESVSGSPTLTISTDTTVFTAPSAPVVVDPNLTLTYPGGPDLTGARVSIATGFMPTQDALAVATQGGISGSFNTSTGILTLTGTASAETYETALRSVTYANSAGASPDVRARQISFSIGASSLFFADTQHYYEFVTSSGITWSDAQPAAAARTFFGLQGYLVTVTSAAENTFVASKLAGQGWIGASDSASEKTWRWVTGPEGAEIPGGRIFFNENVQNGPCNGIGGARGVAANGQYYSWASCEPNNAGGENYAHFLANGQWNDYPNNAGGNIQGYVTEYGGMASDPVVQIAGTKNLIVVAGCTLDSHCPAGRFCEPATKMCKPTLEAGVAIPTDTLHSGACNPSNASAVCTTSACNTTLNTCASTNGAGCTSTAMCVSNICGENGSCGQVTGGTGCTPATASAYCQSGACSSSGVCIPAAAGSCYVDNDCSAGYFCRRDLFACKPILNVGVTIPDDGLHGGTCSVSVAMAVCSSGACNATTGTCGDVLGSTCSEAADCVGNVCGSNSRCGATDGAGACSPATAATVCQSGTCSAGSVCMPAGAGRCWIDVDCASAEYCDRATAQCAAKLTEGASIPGDGLHDGTCATAATVCASGLCNGSTSTCAGVNGTGCSDNSGCVGNICGSNGRCGVAVGDGNCTPSDAADLCQSGKCSTAGVCQPAAVGGCWVDADCAAGQYCDAMALACHGKVVAGDALPDDRRLHDGVCTTGLASAVCEDGACNAVTNTCGSSAGTACTSPAFCAVNVCNGAGFCGYGLGEGTCQSSNAGTRCASHLCSTAGFCLSSAPGNCWADADCNTGSFCARLGTTCQLKLAAGAPLPIDAIHNGFCTALLASAVCSTGACNSSTSTCSSAVGAGCALSSACTNNACGANLKCGLTAGAGPCTAQNASKVCQSGVCGPESGVCVPADPGGCGSDADCSAAAYCDGVALSCRPRLATGDTLPADGTHGACAGGLNAACGTGLCNITAQTCASATGTTCSDATTCATNVCGRNGKCGLDDGQPGCTLPTASNCQSGVCTSAGVCGALGCVTDAGCPVASAFCDASLGLCKAKLVVGQALPTDSLHDGRCDSSSSGTVCVSGACNATTRTCALANGEVCHVDAQCAMNACGSDQLCGLADGQAGCTTAIASICRSGICSAKGNRCVPTGSGRCAVDADCSGATFCAPATLSCVARLGSGVAIPKDGLHDDGCLPGIAATVCMTGKCNSATTTCAGATGATCATAAECANEVCGINGICGRDDGKGPCDDPTEMLLCQSGVCNGKLGLCQPIAAGSCLEDLDCPSGSFCAPATRTCTGKLTAGTTIPNDGLHGGVCDQATAMAVCASGQCNPQANTCAQGNGETCSTAAACVNGLCPADGVCGKAVGATCDRASDCRSATCTGARCTTSLFSITPGGDEGCDCAVGGNGGSGALLLLALAAARYVRRRRAPPKDKRTPPLGM